MRIGSLVKLKYMKAYGWSRFKVASDSDDVGVITSKRFCLGVGRASPIEFEVMWADETVSWHPKCNLAAVTEEEEEE